MRRGLLVFTILLTLVMSMALLPNCSGYDSDNASNDGEAVLDETSATETAETPELQQAVQEINDKTFDLVVKYAAKLDGDWGDKHVSLIESGLREEYKGYEDMRTLLKGYIEESGALYIYALYPTGSGKKPFIVTVDGSADPDDYGFKIMWEPPFTSAWEGTAASSGCAYFDKYTTNDLAWTAYAPIHDSDGNVAAILGVDYPAPEINDYPEWNSESDKWNGVEILK